MIRLFSDIPLKADQLIELEEAQAHYVNSVMRLNAGDDILLFNGIDGEWHAQIFEGRKKRCSVQIIAQSRVQENVPDLWLVFAPIKKQRLDFIIEKATELGVDRLLPVITQNTISSKVRTDRLKAQSIEAAEQCERLTIPEVSEPVNLKKLLEDWPEERVLLVLDEKKNAKPIHEALIEFKKDTNFVGPSALLVGPEGGFDPSELDLLAKKPFVTRINVGPRILRADTACLAALSCWQAVLGDWQIPLKNRIEEVKGK